MAVTVAIADQHTDFIFELRDELESHSFKVHTASSMSGILRILSDHPVRVLIAGLQIGTGSGLELLRVLPLRSPETRVVVIAADASADDYVQALKLGAVQWLTKPVAPAAVVDAVRTALDCHRGFCGNLHGIALPELLQMLHFGRRSVSVHLENVGAIHMRDGEIIHAEHGRCAGAAALMTLLEVKSGSIRTTALQGRRTTISRPFEALILESLCAVDERQAARRTSGLLARDALWDEREAGGRAGTPGRR